MVFVGVEFDEVRVVVVLRNKCCRYSFSLRKASGEFHNNLNSQNSNIELTKEIHEK